MIKLTELSIKKLKKPLYHGTSCNKIDSIKKYGLGIDYPPVHIETGVDKKGRLAKKGIYVTDDIESVIAYAYDASKDVEPHQLDIADGDEKNMCVVKINSVPYNAKIGSDGYGSYMINRAIPPECFKILNPDDLKKILNVDNLMDAL